MATAPASLQPLCEFERTLGGFTYDKNFSSELHGASFYDRRRFFLAPRPVSKNGLRTLAFGLPPLARGASGRFSFDSNLLSVSRCRSRSPCNADPSRSMPPPMA